jgi:recombinational DNA repair ATPase RecF
VHISHLVIKNFRAIEDIQFELAPRINVIVGPNAIGKTTILQAIRLPKALVAPRSQNEAQQVLISLGAMSPHFPQRMLFDAVARQVATPVEIRCTYKLTDTEIVAVQRDLADITLNVIQSRLGQPFATASGRRLRWHGKSAGKIDATVSVSLLTLCKRED